MKLPSNGVTRMPVEAQQREADEILEKIIALEGRLSSLKAIHFKRLQWIELAKQGEEIR